jgi:hypothetical protein
VRLDEPLDEEVSQIKSLLVDQGGLHDTRRGRTDSRSVSRQASR